VAACRPTDHPAERRDDDEVNNSSQSNCGEGLTLAERAGHRSAFASSS